MSINFSSLVLLSQRLSWQDLQAPERSAFAHFYVSGLHRIRNVRCSSGGFVVFWYGVWLCRVGWQSCVKNAGEGHLALVMGLVLLGAWYVFQDVENGLYFWITVLIRDRVVVTGQMIFSDIAVIWTMSWESFGDSNVLEWVTVIWVYFVGVVVSAKIYFSICERIIGCRFEDCWRTFLSWWDASVFDTIVISFLIRFGRVCVLVSSWLIVSYLTAWMSLQGESSISDSDEAYRELMVALFVYVLVAYCLVRLFVSDCGMSARLDQREVWYEKGIGANRKSDFVA